MIIRLFHLAGLVTGALASLTNQMSGDSNPPGYSVLNLDLDTIERPASVTPTVMGFVNGAKDELETSENKLIHTLRNMTRYVDEVVESMLRRTTLQRKGLIPVSFGQIFSEPNLGPFPQYNILMEDVPIEDTIASLEHDPVRHFSMPSLTAELEKIRTKSLNDYQRLRTALESPAFQAAKSTGIMGMLKPTSFYQAHAQFVEDNVVPFQEITIHPESAPPRGGDAPPRGQAVPAILALNATKTTAAFKIMAAQEEMMLNILKKIDKGIRRNRLDL